MWSKKFYLRWLLFTSGGMLGWVIDGLTGWNGFIVLGGSKSWAEMMDDFVHDPRYVLSALILGFLLASTKDE
jgi:hypothetical protein